MSKELLYPQRQRCRKCRRLFVHLVVNRLFDSYECAGMIDVTLMPVSQLPRQCRTKTLPKGTLRAKRRFDTPEEAERAARWKNKAVYHCELHGAWHIGGTNVAAAT